MISRKKGTGKNPKQASLRRAVSTAYYALFHLLIDEAVSKVGGGNGTASIPRQDFRTQQDEGNLRRRTENRQERWQCFARVEYRRAQFHSASRASAHGGLRQLKAVARTDVSQRADPRNRMPLLNGERSARRMQRRDFLRNYSCRNCPSSSAGCIAIILVVHTSEEQNGEEEIRIISARKASPRERALYHAYQ